MGCLSKMKIEIYGAPNCTYCKQAMFLCESEGIDYDYFCMMTDFDKALEAQERVGTPFKSVPQIFVDGNHIGGFTDLEKLLDDDKG